MCFFIDFIMYSNYSIVCFVGVFVFVFVYYIRHYNNNPTTAGMYACGVLVLVFGFWFVMPPHR